MGSLEMVQKVVALTESYDILQNGAIKYTAKKKLVAAGAEFEVLDGAGNRVGYIDQKLLSMVKTYKMFVYGNPAGEVKKKMVSLTRDLTYDARGWKIDGDLIGKNFKIVDQGGAVQAAVSKNMIGLSDKYKIDFANDGDEILMILLTIIIDEVFHSKRS